MNYSTNNNFCSPEEARDIIHFCLENGEPFSYNPTESWDCRRIYEPVFKEKIFKSLNSKYKNGDFKLWFDYATFIPKNFNISLTAYYDGRYLNLHKDKSSELTTVIVLSEDFEGGNFALSIEINPSFHFESLDNISTFDLKLGDSITFDGSKTFHGVLPVTKGIRYALNIWMTETDFNYSRIKNNKTIF